MTPPPASGDRGAGVSVALCTYNGARFLPEQLDSITRQTVLPAEVVIRDDRSQDDTVRVAQEWAATVPFQVRVEVNAENLGSTRNFAGAIAECTGGLIVLCDQDDVWLPHKLERLARLFADDPRAEVVFTDGWVVDQGLVKQGLLSKSMGFRGAAILKAISRDRILGRLAMRCLATGATMAFRTGLRAQVLPIPDGLPPGIIHDGWIALVAALRGGLRFLDEPLILYRQHAGQQVGVIKNTPDANRWKTGQARRAMLDTLPDSTDRLVRTVVARYPEHAGRMAPFHDQLAHLQVRGKLPDSRAGRVLPVLGELLRGRYHRYAKGFRTGLADLFY